MIWALIIESALYFDKNQEISDGHILRGLVCFVLSKGETNGGDMKSLLILIMLITTINVHAKKPAPPHSPVVQTIPAFPDPEPQWCSPSEFMKNEITGQPGIRQAGKFERGRVFKVDGITLVGVGVGKSDHVGLQRMYDSLSQSSTGQDPKYCTWYFNEGNKPAQRVFNHFPMSKPSSNAGKAEREWMAKLGGIFEGNANNVKKCLEEDKYVAFGCNGQKHRGPTAFGMLLSYMGCSAENSEKITRQLWGLNGIKATSRVAINRGAFRAGQQPRYLARQQREKEGQEPLVQTSEPKPVITTSTNGATTTTTAVGVVNTTEGPLTVTTQIDLTTDSTAAE